MIGCALEERGAEMANDQPRQQRVLEKRSRIEALIDAGNRFWAFPFPIPSLSRDHFVRAATEEHAYYAAMGPQGEVTNK